MLRDRVDLPTSGVHIKKDNGRRIISTELESSTGLMGVPMMVNIMRDVKMERGKWYLLIRLRMRGSGMRTKCMVRVNSFGQTVHPTKELGTTT